LDRSAGEVCGQPVRGGRDLVGGVRLRTDIGALRLPHGRGLRGPTRRARHRSHARRGGGGRGVTLGRGSGGSGGRACARVASRHEALLDSDARPEDGGGEPAGDLDGRPAAGEPAGERPESVPPEPWQRDQAAENAAPCARRLVVELDPEGPARTEEQRLNSRHRHVHRGRDLHVRASSDLAKDEGLALRGAQPLERDPDVVGRRALAIRCRDELGVELDLQRPGSARAEPPARGVLGDGQEPGLRLLRLIPAAQRPVGVEEGRLSDVLGLVGISHVPQDEAVDVALVARVKALQVTPGLHLRRNGPHAPSLRYPGGREFAHPPQVSAPGPTPLRRGTDNARRSLRPRRAFLYPH